MKADQIWEVDHLREKIREAIPLLKKEAGGPHGEGPGTPAYMMVDVLAPAGYHQRQAIADAFGLDFEENFSNEDEWERFWREMDDLKARMDQDLRQRLELPRGLRFSLGFDPEGNFGLVLRPAGPETSSPPRCSPPQTKEIAS